MRTVQVIAADVGSLATFLARLTEVLGEPWSLVEGTERVPVTETILRARYREGCFGLGRAEYRLERSEADGDAVEIRLVLQPPDPLARVLPHRLWDDPVLEELERPADGYVLVAPTLELRAGFVACCRRHLDVLQTLRPVLELTGDDPPEELGADGLAFTRLALAGDLRGVETWLRRERKQETPSGRTQRSHLLVAIIFLVAVVTGLLVTIFSAGPDPAAGALFELRQELVRDRAAGYPGFAELARRLRDELTSGREELVEPAWSYAAGRLESLMDQVEAVDRRDLEEAVLGLHVQALCAPGEQQGEAMRARQRVVFSKLRGLVTRARSTAELQPLARLADELLAGVRKIGEGPDPEERSLALALEVFYAEALRVELEGRLQEVAANGELGAPAALRGMVRHLEDLRRRVVEADLGSTTLLPEVEEALAFLRRFPLAAGGSCRVELVLRQLRIDGHPEAFAAAIDLEEKWWLLLGVFLRSGIEPAQVGPWHKGFDFSLSRSGEHARVLARLPGYLLPAYRSVFDWSLDTEVTVKLMEDDAAGDDALFEVSSRDPAVRRGAWALRGLDVLFVKTLSDGVRVGPAGRPAPAGGRALTVALEFDLVLDGRRVEAMPALLATLGAAP